MIPRVLLGWFVVNLTLVAQDGSLHVVVLEGDGAINNIRLPHAKEPVVRVEDANNRGVAGAVVTFLLPSGGAGAFFGDSGASLTMITDDRGEVMARGLHPNRIAGTFQIRVTASRAGRTAATAISQTNVDPGAHTSTRTIALLAIIGAAAGGAAVALHGGKAKSATPVPTSTIVVPGTPSFGGPQ
jgi:hypothetical protein